MDQSNYTESLKKAVQIAQQIAREFQNNNFSASHLLKAILHKDVDLLPYLLNSGKDVLYLEEWADVRIESYPKSGKLDSIIRGDETIATVFEEAENVKLKLGKDSLDPICILIALATPGVGFTYDQLKTFPLTSTDLLNDFADLSDMSKAVPKGMSDAGKTTGGAEGGGAANALLRFCIDKTAKAKEGKIDPIVGRDREVRMVTEILGRRGKPNVIITGEPGVGKTALVDGFALSIANGTAPQNLANAVVFELDFGALVAGASYKGEVEDRLKSIIKEIKQFEKAILFIDEMHVLLDKNGGAAGAAQLLKPELARGEITIIGATTTDEYRKHIEKDEAFSRRFEVIKVEEPDERTAAKMLEIILPFYEKHHNLKVNSDALPEGIRLAKRYDKDRKLPDSSIDLLDRTMASIRMMGENSKEEIKKLKERLKEVQSLFAKEEDDVYLKELKWFYNQLQNKVSHILLNKVEETNGIDKIEYPVDLFAQISLVLEKLTELAEEKKDTVEKSDLLATISFRTGIPIGKVQTQEKERLLKMGDYLRNRVIGQDQALKSVSEAVLEARSGLNKAGQPIGSFFFLGPTGTGKTELGKAIAEFLFDDEKQMIRYDMSEFKEEHSVALLYGAPPGYVGYEEGGKLVNDIRQKPYSIVLFDEIEKAHPKVFDLFLQILDEGKLHDRLGKVGDFSNSIILFTSNVGSEYIINKFNNGEVPTSQELLEVMQQQKLFRPEFLARLTEIVPFAPISEKSLMTIFEYQMRDLLKSLKNQGIVLTVTDKAKEVLSKTGFDPKMGARQVGGVVRTFLRRPLSKMIISGEIGKGTTLEADVNDAGEVVWNKK
jgi:ATP-dependent Clp protease ATP-binding subunit ClpA